MEAVSRLKPLKKMNLIVAMDADGGIGKNGTLPWRIRKDMQYFAQVTKKTDDPSKKNAVLMGRKCWDSIPEARRPLPGRLNIVLSRQLPVQKTSELVVLNSWSDLLEMLAEPEFWEKIENVWNIGGREIYKMALDNDFVDEIHMTRIFQSFDADVHLRDLNFYVEQNEKIGKLVVEKCENSEIFEENGTKFEFCKWKCT